MDCCNMKGFLSYLIMWNLGKRSMTGVQLAEELKARKGSKPSPGTIYPALKELKENGFIKSNNSKSYSLTTKGKKELNDACSQFSKMFYDMKDMCKCCSKS